MNAALGLDAGGSGTRWRLVDKSGTEIASGHAPALTGHLFRSDARAAAGAALDTLATALSDADVHAVVAGVTGLSAEAPEAAALAAALVARLGVAPTAIAVHDDQWLAYRAAFALGEGILVYGGTGSFACHIDAGGTLHRAGGHGYVLGDGGSAFWIGRAALAALLDAQDAAGAWPAGPLADGPAEAIGGKAWDDIRRYAYTEPRRHVAALARAVALAADAGDAAAIGVLEGAGKELAHLATRLADRFGPLPLGLAGAAALGHPAVFRAFEATLAWRWPDDPRDVRRIDTPPVTAAARLAAEMLRTR